ncbi:ankyrin [Neocallimastix sp. 'constans']
MMIINNKELNNNNIEMVKLLMNYAIENQIILNINDKDDYGRYPLLIAINNKNEKDIENEISKKWNNNRLENILDINSEFISLLNKYRNKNSIIELIFSENSRLSKMLNEMNKKENNMKKEKIIEINDTIKNNNVAKLKKILNDAIKNEIVLDFNEKDEDGWYSLLIITNNNTNNYTKRINNKLKINEQDIENAISSNYYGNSNLKDISKINIEFIRLLYDYKNKNIIEIIFNENGELSKKFNELSIQEKIEENKIKKERNKRKKINDDNLLTFECKKENIDEVKKLINKGMKINKRNRYGDTPLIIACKKNNIELVKCLLKSKKIKIDKKSIYGISPLMVACYFKNKSLVDCLITQNAKVDISDNKNNLPLHIGCYLGHIEIIQSLMEKNKTLSNKINSYKDTPLTTTYKLNDNNKLVNILLGKLSENDNSYSKNKTSTTTNIRENYMLNRGSTTENNKYYNKINRSICKIKTTFTGTGFFIEIPIPSEKYPMRGLMTNNHVLNENNLKTGNSFIIYLANDEKQATEIKINDEDFIFTSELIDVTFIEINYKIIKEINPIFLKPSNKDAKINESILIFQYAKAEYSLSHGNIINVCGFNYYHEVLTNNGSSGSPLLNKNYEVVGIHKSKVFTDNEIINKASKFSEVKFAIETLFNNINIYGMERAKKSAKLLLKPEMDIMNDYGLELKLSSDDIDRLKHKILNEKEIKEEEEEEKKKKKKKKKKEEEQTKIKLDELKLVEKSLFYCEFNNKLLFYRTNYSWYVTVLSRRKNNFISEYDLDNIKQLNWFPIISNRTKLNKYINSKIKGREYVLITWLKLSELMSLEYVNLNFDLKYRLNQINIPGIHDTGTFHVEDYNFLAETQQLNIKEQLLNGIRYLDIRLSDVDRNISHEIYITHGDIFGVTIYCLKEGAAVDRLKFDDVINDTIDFF